jgi:cyclic pyranopterin monophosphate synthase
MSKLTHTDNQGKANMVDVGGKPEQLRIAKAEGVIILQVETIQLIRENNLKKGDVLTIAQIAGIQAAKQTSSLIPLCHPLQLTKVDVHMKILKHGVKASSKVQCIGQTGVEMEALTAVSVALLTVYDMCKAVDKNMMIDGIHLIEKTKTNPSISKDKS